MKIGRMNNPMRNLISEVNWTGKHNFDFLDLTLEPPNAHPDKVDLDSLRDLIAKYKLEVIGHTAYYLPYTSPYSSLARASIDELVKCMELLDRLDVRRMAVHPDEASAGIWGRARAIERNIRMIKIIVREAKRYEIRIMIENTPRLFNEVDELKRLFNEVEGVGFLLDVGHANLNTRENKTRLFLQHFRDRLEHVHLSDNMGGSSDLHLPIGAGGIPWESVIKWFKEAEYDGTFTLEVFSRDYEYILISREKLRRMWRD
ncbi:TPA: sugar phosphate isomerase/epimerase [Candidatus Poribacteria bacterium]|nr:sugar phosphate isomerase/epimerase [Candidatus Poribacteria bacterium]HEX30622.1 sugar phosphate isomerase/epimerase [Candidatus Poribacteria bacterium]